MCLGDVEYQAFRREVRSTTWQQTFLAKPLMPDELRQRVRRLHTRRRDATAPRAWLARALDQSVFLSRKVVPLDPWWDKVRGSPEFEAALKAPAK